MQKSEGWPRGSSFFYLHDNLSRCIPFLAVINIWRILVVLPKLRDEGKSLIQRTHSNICGYISPPLTDTSTHTGTGNSDETRRNSGCVLHCSCFLQKTYELRMTKQKKKQHLPSCIIHASQAGNTFPSCVRLITGLANVIKHFHQAEEL